MKPLKKKLITTDLVSRREVFNILALCESVSVPCLFIGPPGVGKTKALLQYVFSPYDDEVSDEELSLLTPEFYKAEKYNPDDVFVIQADYDTRAREIKGFIDPEALVVDKQYKLIVPAAEARAILVDEVEKSSGSFRSSMMSLLNEKKIMNGRFHYDAKWKIFCASCNEVPQEEAKSAFWDRWVVKYTIDKLSQSELISYYKEGSSHRKEQFAVPVPNDEQIDAVPLPHSKYGSFVEIAYEDLSTRTMAHVPRIAKAVSLIWEVDINNALIKTMQLLVSPEKAHTLSDRIMSPDYKDILSKIRSLKMASSVEDFKNSLSSIESLVISKHTSNKITDDELASITKTLKEMASARATS